MNYSFGGCSCLKCLIMYLHWRVNDLDLVLSDQIASALLSSDQIHLISIGFICLVTWIPSSTKLLFLVGHGLEMLPVLFLVSATTHKFDGCLAID